MSSTTTTATAPAASTSRLPPTLPPPTVPPPPPAPLLAPPHPPTRSGKRSSKRLSANTNLHPSVAHLNLNSNHSGSSRKQKPSLSHVINHLRDSPPANLTSFLSLDSATTPASAAYHHYHSHAQTPLTAASINSNYHGRAMSPMTLMELPPLRMEGLTRESVFVDQALSSASSYTVTPIWELSSEASPGSRSGGGAGMVKGVREDAGSGGGKRDSMGGVSERTMTPTPPTSAGTTVGEPRSSLSSPSQDTLLKVEDRLRLDLDFGGDILDEWNSSPLSSSPSRAQTPFNSPLSTAKANSDSQPFSLFPTSTLSTTAKHEDGVSDSSVHSSTPGSSSLAAFLEEVDRWLLYIENRMSQLETRHLRLNVA